MVWSQEEFKTPSGAMHREEANVKCKNHRVFEKGSLLLRLPWWLIW